MKNIIIGAILMVLFSSCSKSSPDLKIEPLPEQLGLTLIYSKLVIEPKDTSNIVMNVQRPQGYSGEYFLRCSQHKGNGVGVLRYSNISVKMGEIIELKSDIFTLNYEAITGNYHRLDFTVYDDQGNSVSESVVMNEEKQGVDDFDFSYRLGEIPSVIRENERVKIEIFIDRSVLYEGKFNLYYNQDTYVNGKGNMEYRGNAMESDTYFELQSDTIILHYTAVTANYHQLDFELLDEVGNVHIFNVIFNADKQGVSDYGFILRKPNLQTTVQQNGVVNISITLIPGKLYTGRYFIKYNQVRGEGFGSLKCNSKVLSKGISSELKDNIINLSYNALSANYHKLDLTIFDELSNEEHFIIEFNRSKKGVHDIGFHITHDPYTAKIEKEVVYTFYLTKIDLDYKGSYYVKVSRKAGSHRLKLGKESSSPNMDWDTRYRLTLNADKSFHFRSKFIGIWPISSKAVNLELSIYDDYGNRFTHSIIHNK